MRAAILFAACACLSVAAVLSWYLFSPLSDGPVMWIRSDNRDVLDTDLWNWGFTFQAAPKLVATPKTIDEVVSLVGGASHVRVVGGGHSFSTLIATDDLLLDLREINTITHEDDRVRVGGGTKIRDLQHALLARGRVVHGFGGGTHHQSVAGAISTNLHGAQRVLFADHVTELTVVKADGTVCTLESNEPLFHAVKSGMGEVGIVVEMVLSTHERVCHRVAATRRSLEDAVEAIHHEGDAADFKTTGHGIHRHGVLTTWNRTADCEVDYPRTDYRDMGAAYVSDNWIMAAQVLLMPLVGRTAFFHNLVTTNFEAADNTVVGVENGWRAAVAPMFGQVYTEYSVPSQNCSAVMAAIDRTARSNDVMVSGMTIKSVGPEPNTLLAYARIQSCALEVYYLPCQQQLRRTLLAVQQIVFDAGGRSHLGKHYYPDDRPIYHRRDMVGVAAFEAIREQHDPGRKLNLRFGDYDIDFDRLHSRAVAFRVLVTLAAAAGIAALVACCQCRRTADV